MPIILITKKMFKKFLEKNQEHNGVYFIQLNYNWLSFIIFRLTTLKVDEIAYHLICKGNSKKRGIKMSLFSSITREEKEQLSYYENGRYLYIMNGRKGIMVLK